MNPTTPRIGFSLAFLGHVQTEQELVKNFTKLDALVAPTPVTADVGKVLTVVDVAGVPTPMWV